MPNFDEQIFAREIEEHFGPLLSIERVKSELLDWLGRMSDDQKNQIVAVRPIKKQDLTYRMMEQEITDGTPDGRMIVQCFRPFVTDAINVAGKSSFREYLDP